MLVFFPFFPAMMLAIECHNVIDRRLWKIATGAVHAGDETQLMVSEKLDAAIEAGSLLMTGKGSADVIELYRKRVAANVERLA